MSRKISIGGVLQHQHMCMLEILGIPDLPGSAGKAFALFGDEGISLEFISETEASDGLSNITCCFHTDNCKTVQNLHQNILTQTGSREIKTQCPVEIITIYGPHFSTKPSIAATFCKALGEKNINLLGITTSINSITCVINSKMHDIAFDAINEHFDFPT